MKYAWYPVAHSRREVIADYQNKLAVWRSTVLHTWYPSALGSSNPSVVVVTCNNSKRLPQGDLRNRIPVKHWGHQPKWLDIVHNPAVASTFFWSSCCPYLPVSQCSSAYSLVQFFPVYTFHVWAHTRSSMSVARRVSSVSPLISPFMSYFPPCLLFPDGHFETTFLTATATTSSPPTVSLLANLQSARSAHSVTSNLESGYLANPRSPQVAADRSTICLCCGPFLPSCW